MTDDPKKDESNTCVVVRGDGTDAEIAKRCAKEVPGWDKLIKEEREELITLQRRYWEMGGSPSFQHNARDAGKLSIGTKGTTTLNTLRLVAAFGSSEDAVANARISDWATYYQATNNRAETDTDLMAFLAFVQGGGAEDPVQSALLTQMNATHDAAMRALKMIGKSEWVDQAQMFGNLSTKLLHAYARQAETLRKLQKGGEQTVRHVHVDNRGGQAVFTEQVNQTGGIPHNVDSQAQEQHPSRDGSAAMLGYDPAWHGVPAASPSREETMCAPRRQVDGTEGSDGK